MSVDSAESDTVSRPVENTRTTTAIAMASGMLSRTPAEPRCAARKPNHAANPSTARPTT